MDTRTLLVTVIVVLAFHLSGCSSPNTSEHAAPSPPQATNIKPDIAINRPRVGMPNPAAVYCHALGYEYRIVVNDKGNQSGFCLLPDGSTCSGRDFYRGDCGQKWSYCERCGYSVKKLQPMESLRGGTICINKTTKEPIGTILNLVVFRYLRGEPLDELRR